MLFIPRTFPDCWHLSALIGYPVSLYRLQRKRKESLTWAH